MPHTDEIEKHNESENRARSFRRRGLTILAWIILIVMAAFTCYGLIQIYFVQ